MRVTIIADASHCPDTGAGGYGFWIASERGKGPGGGPLTGKVDSSGAAEMLALCNALAAGLRHGLIADGDVVLMQTDCQSAILAFSGARTQLSADERKASRFLSEERRKHNLSISFRHVKGHTRRGEARYTTNRLCDQRAREGMLKSRAELKGDSHV